MKMSGAVKIAEVPAGFNNPQRPEGWLRAVFKQDDGPRIVMYWNPSIGDYMSAHRHFDLIRDRAGIRSWCDALTFPRTSA